MGLIDEVLGLTVVWLGDGELVWKVGLILTWLGATVDALGLRLA